LAASFFVWNRFSGILPEGYLAAQTNYRMSPDLRRKEGNPSAFVRYLCYLASQFCSYFTRSYVFSVFLLLSSFQGCSSLS